MVRCAKGHGDVETRALLATSGKSKKKRLRKRTHKSKKRNRGANNIEIKRNIINAARKIARQRISHDKKKIKQKTTGPLHLNVTPKQT